MNPLLSTTNPGEYYDFEDVNIIAIDDNDPSAGSLIEFTESGIQLVVNDALKIFENTYKERLLDPMSYIRHSIQTMINTSSASQEVKDRLYPRMEIGVTVIEGRPSSNGGLIGAGWKPKTKTQYVSLEDIVTDRYRHKIKDNTELSIEWPSFIPKALRKTFESANLQKDYEHEVKRYFNNPDAKFINRLLLKKEVEERIQYCTTHPQLSETFKNVAKGYASGKTVLKVVEYRSYASHARLSRMLMLQEAGDTSAAGVLIFLGEPKETACFGLPKQGRRWIIENSRRLNELTLQQLTLSRQLKAGNSKLIYHTIYPVGGPRVIAPLQFYAVEDDVFETLQETHIEKLISDIDTLISTDGERLVSGLLDIGITVAAGMSALAFGASVIKGGVGYLLASFLAGQSVSTLRVIQAAHSDNPDDLLLVARREVVATFVSVIGIILNQQLISIAESVAVSPVYIRLTEQLGQLLSRTEL